MANSEMCIVNETKEHEILRVLHEIFKRPLFISIGYSAFEDVNTHLTVQSQIASECEIEIVGSSKDGLKTSKVFDVGDTDALVYSHVTFDETDESTFEYKPGIQNFFHIPLPEKVSYIATEDGKYLNAQSVRNFDSRIFGSKTNKNYKPLTYTLFPKGVERSELKCATTENTAYADPVFEREYQAPEDHIDHKLYIGWHTEHLLFAYLLFKSNEEKITFVRELLYGAESEIEGEEHITTKLKQIFGFFKQDFQKSIFGVHDMLYFKSKEFLFLLDKAIDKDLPSNIYLADAPARPHGAYSTDLVPAIRCSSWPRPANGYRQRKREWPSKEVVDEIVQSGFQIIPKASVIDPNPTKDFILSFSPSEVKLLRSLPDKAKTAYRILKLCYKSVKSETEQRNSLKTYHLKTALLWVAENTTPDSWASNNVLWGIRCIIEFLLKCLGKRHFPSFFVEDSNLIAHFSKVDAEMQSDLLTLIYRNPANFVKAVIDKEWQFTQATMPDDSFETIQDPDYFKSFTWLELMKLLFHSQACVGGYQIDDMMESIPRLTTEELFSKYNPDPFNTTPPGNESSKLDINESQLQHVQIFVQTVSEMKMDLFNVLDLDVDKSIVQYSETWIDDKTLELYPQFDLDADKQYGDHLKAVTKLRLKYYGNTFHIICERLKAATVQSVEYRNQDVVYIIQFLKNLATQKGYTVENIEDLLHSLFFFCHFTRLRYHKLTIADQILRSIREFLQHARDLMTVYFNPSLIYPVPVNIGDSAKTVLGECFQKTESSGDKCSFM